MRVSCILYFIISGRIFYHQIPHTHLSELIEKLPEILKSFSPTNLEKNLFKSPLNFEKKLVS